MWFRNLLVYRLTQPLTIDAETLDEALSHKRARPCGSQELATFGFAAPIGKGPDAPLVHGSSGFLLLAAQREERILPGSVVRDALLEKIEEIETAQARKVYKKEREQLKEEVLQTLLPRAFLRRRTLQAVIAPELGLVLVNSSSRPRAEELLSALREALESLPVKPLEVSVAPSFTFTEWLKAPETSGEFTVLDECELRDAQEDGGVIRCKRQDLGSDEVRRHIDAGKRVTQLSLAWQDKLTFTLDDTLIIKRLRFEDILQEQAMQESGDDALSQQDATFTLMMLTFRDFLPQLIAALGGEEGEQKA